MDNNKIKKVISESTVIIHKERYAYLRANETEIKNHFMISRDEQETTIITKEENLPNTKFNEVEKWFKLIEVDLSVPFTAGFVAAITKIVADAGCNAPAISTFSKDYILVRENQIEDATQALKKAGFKSVIEK
jgi:hypothetical protein